MGAGVARCAAAGALTSVRRSVVARLAALENTIAPSIFASISTTGLAMGDISVDEFDTQAEIEYEGERYLVRDNGAICRRAKQGGRKRRLDGVWTFGRPSDATGYMTLSSHVVHRIVAFAFHPQPTRQHVVDHIDTNRRNNRADNLRWVTRLENVLLNPVTRRRVVLAYGSVEAFFLDPSAVISEDRDFSWMRTVTKAEAQVSRERLLKWSERSAAPKGGQLGEWLYRTPSPPTAIWIEAKDVQSATRNAVQRHWRVVGEFPACPESVGPAPLTEYAALLPPGTAFYRSTFGDSRAEIVGVHDDVLVVVSTLPPGSVKSWAVAKVTVEDGKFVHEAFGTYFAFEGAVNVYNELLMIDAPHVETIDDFC